MREEKFQSEIKTLDKFFTKYCEDKHSERFSKEYYLKYKECELSFSIYLCKDCHELITYSFEKLSQCPHEIKPRCRKCPSPCYEKPQWKKLAKLMRYSGFQFGLLKVKKFIVNRKF